MQFETDVKQVADDFGVQVHQPTVGGGGRHRVLQVLEAGGDRAGRFGGDRTVLGGEQNGPGHTLGDDGGADAVRHLP